MTNTMNLMDIINEQKTTRRGRVGNYTEYGSKKKLFNADILTEEQVDVITKLKGTFTFNMHNDLQYLIITMYDRKRPQGEKYWFLIVNLDDMTVEEAPSIKLAKERVDSIVAGNSEQVEEVTDEAVNEPVEDEVTEEEEVSGEEEAVDYTTMKVTELKDEMNARNLKVEKGMVKEDLIAALQEDDKVEVK